MRLLSRVWQPLAANTHQNSAVAADTLCRSQKLLYECGVTRGSNGLLSLLPLGHRAYLKLERLVAACFESVGANRVLLPSLVPAALWRQTGRLGGDGGGDGTDEIITLKDRQRREYVLAPTHEESITALLAEGGPLSYKHLPLLLYQISCKFRDEPRPKHGLLRARQFTMADLYGAHSDEHQAQVVYDDVTAAYHTLFTHMQLNVHRVSAPPGAMGGAMSHEWQLPAAAGEDRVLVCPSCSHARRAHEGEKDSTCDQCGHNVQAQNSIEVGHTFMLGSRYSAPLQALVAGSDGSARPLIMTCYGIGLTRLLSAAVESLSSERGVVWPRCIAPYSALVIGPKEGSKESAVLGPEGLAAVCAALARRAPAAGGQGPFTARHCDHDDILVDDRHHLTVGKRLLLAEKVGYPVIVVLGRSLLLAEPHVELRVRRDVTHGHYTVTTRTLSGLLGDNAHIEADGG